MPSKFANFQNLGIFLKVIFFCGSSITHKDNLHWNLMKNKMHTNLQFGPFQLTMTLLRKPIMIKEIYLMHSPLTIWMNEYTFDFLYSIDLYGDLTLYGCYLCFWWDADFTCSITTLSFCLSKVCQLNMTL